MAVGSSGDRVMTSPDGITWTLRSAATAATWRGVTWSADLGLFCAVAQDGNVMTSPDGLTWALQTAQSASLFSVAWSPELGLFAAVDNNAGAGTNRIFTSPDGVTWTKRYSGTQAKLLTFL